jgi:hypothetical protein
VHLKHYNKNMNERGEYYEMLSKYTSPLVNTTTIEKSENQL